MQQPTMRVELHEVFKTNFSLFEKYDYNVRREQINKLTYIETIAMQLEKNLTGVNLFDILKNNNNIILATNAEINEALIKFNRDEYFKEVKEEVKEFEKLNEEQIKSIDGAFHDMFLNRKRDLENYAHRYQRDAVSAMENYTHYRAKRSECLLELQTLKKSDSSDIVRQINEDILTKPHYKFAGLDGSNRLLFILDEDVICTHKNDRAGIHFRVNLGKFKLRIRFNDGLRCEVINHQNNVWANDYIHPHISGGNICLGNMKELYEEAQDNNNILQMMEVARSILHNFNPDDPYIQLEQFAIASGQVQPNGEVLERDTDCQYHICPECEHEHEVDFDGSSFAEAECPNCGYYTEYEWYD